MVSGKIMAAVVFVIVVVVIAGFAIYYNDAYRKLTFELKGVSLTSASFTLVATNFEIAMGNPGPLPIYVPSGSFDVYINGVAVGVGSFSSQTISGNSVSLNTVPVDFNPTTLPSVILGLITGGGTVNIAIAGSANLVLFSIPFNSTLHNASFK
jgi:LEA14-like dessication related protein